MHEHYFGNVERRGCWRCHLLEIVHRPDGEGKFVPVKPVKENKIPWRFIAALILLAALLFSVSGCASARQSPNLPPIIIHMPDPDRTCRTIGTKAMHDTKVLGCADYTGRLSGGVVCTIIVGFNAAKWVIDHELRHCREGEFH